MTFDINLYAEFLLNIRSVTLFATLNKETSEYQQAYINGDRRTISITYNGRSSTIALPLGIRLKGSVGFPVSDPTKISLRLEVVEDEGPSHGLQLDVVNDSPWTSSQLDSSCELACRSCSTLLVPARERVWRNLPRDSWMEVLDQWYCHRPASGSGQESHDFDIHELRALPGLALVDTCYFVFPASDCLGLKTVDESCLRCNTCEAPIGNIESSLDGYKLFKWSLLLRRHCEAAWETNRIQSFICAKLLYLMEDQNVRKFMAYSGSSKEIESAISLWVFNPDIKYSSSRSGDGLPRRAMKLLYEEVKNPQNVLDELHAAVEELPLPSAVLAQLRDDLNASNSLLPEPARCLLPEAAMKQWKVGLLDRFDPSVEA